jgi:hypothetical protein
MRLPVNYFDDQADLTRQRNNARESVQIIKVGFYTLRGIRQQNGFKRLKRFGHIDHCPLELEIDLLQGGTT